MGNIAFQARHQLETNHNLHAVLIGLVVASAIDMKVPNIALGKALNPIGNLSQAAGMGGLAATVGSGLYMATYGHRLPPTRV
jgi:hypothetical protein